MDDALITERRPVTGPQVFGYVRHVTGGLARHAALIDCLADYCRRHELTLCGVFTDRDATLAVRSPAFVGLLDALELPDTYGAVIPALGHLGPKRIAAKRKRQIAATNTRLVVIRSPRPATGRAHSLSAGHDLQQLGGT
ncbi:hypothetical protein ABZ517_10385 [Streptomyces scabiei]|nr:MULTISPECIES: hypothetical protein [Streptomyces]MDX3067123.1 hypothetical protein [Streptomyces sp. ND04-05B]